MDVCLDCNEAFSPEKSYHAKGRCSNCYIKMWQKNKRSYTKKDATGPCLKCGIKVGELNKKGKLCAKTIKGFCISCYQKQNREALCTKCEKCGVQFITGSSVCLCLACRPKSSKVREIKRGDLTLDQYCLMLTLFRRYKKGTNTVVDNFRVIDLYLDIFESQSFVYNSSIGFDGYEEQSQIVLMLRSLKKIYDTV